MQPRKLPPSRLPPPSGNLSLAKLPPSKLAPPGTASKAAVAAPTAPVAAGGPKSAPPPPSKREAMNAARDLDEARKMGLAALAVDTVSGKEISPHVPRSIASVPWYDPNAGATTLAHQRRQIDPNANREEDGSTKVGSGLVVIGAATRFRAGACTNCGSMTHKVKDCTERRRAVGAKFDRSALTGVDAVADNGNYAQRTYEQRHDTSAGVDVAAVAFREFEKSRAIAQAAGESVVTEDTVGAAAHGADGASLRAKALRSESGSAAAADGLAVTSSGAVVGAVSRQLPKYLVNLNAGSAYFDPRTKSLRGDPTAAKSDEDQRYVVRSAAFEGDNARHADDGYAYTVQQMAYLARTVKDGEAGSSFTANSMFLPTANELAFREEQERQRKEAEGAGQRLAERYGPAATPPPPPQPPAGS